MKIGPDPKMFDDIARVAGGAVNLLSGLQQQIQSDIKTRLDEMAVRLDLVPREDLDRAEARIAALEKTVAALKVKIDQKQGTGADKKNTVKKPVKKVSAKKKK
jgi:BMFP domain-containing protein YqiC